MPLPEEKTQIRLVENPVEVAKAAYSLWLPVAERSGFKVADVPPPNQLLTFISDGGFRRLYDGGVADQLYDKAVRTLQPFRSALNRFDSQELSDLVAGIHPELSDASGLFASAMFNLSPVSELESVFTHKIMGYRLAQGKRLTALKGSRISNLGMHSKGAIVNHGYAALMGDGDEGGVQLNYGWAGYLASEPEGRHLMINMGTTILLRYSGRGGWIFNFGSYDSCSFFSGQYVMIDFTKARQFDRRLTNGLIIRLDNGKAYWSNEFSTNMVLIGTTVGPSSHRKQALDILGSLEAKLAEISHMGKMSAEEILKFISEYNWDSYLQDISGIAKKLGNVER